MGKSLQFFNVIGSTSQDRSRHYIEVWPKFAPQNKMASLTPKSSIEKELNCKHEDQSKRDKFAATIYRNILVDEFVVGHIPLNL